MPPGHFALRLLSSFDFRFQVVSRNGNLDEIQLLSRDFPDQEAIREILNPGNGAQAQDMLINLIGTHITIRDQNLPVVNFQFIKGDAADEAAKKAEALKKAGGDKARPVLLSVTCQIIDFDSSKVKKFEAKN